MPATSTEFFTAHAGGAQLAYERVAPTPGTSQDAPALLFCNGLQSARTG